MELIEMESSKPAVDRTKIKIFNLVTQCIKDIENTVSTSGVSMRDVGIGVEKYITFGDSYIIELKLHM